MSRPAARAESTATSERYEPGARVQQWLLQRKICSRDTRRRQVPARDRPNNSAMLEKSICPMPFVAAERIVSGSSVAAATVGVADDDADATADDIDTSSSAACPSAV